MREPANQVDARFALLKSKDEQQALKRLKNDDNIVILPADTYYEALLGSKLKYKLCYGVTHFIRPHC